jgi:hypothetical protein
MKKRYVYAAFFLTVLVVLTGCASMLTKISANKRQKTLTNLQRFMQEQQEANIKKYEEMPFDETIAARFVGTWRNVSNVSLIGVTVFSLSGDGIMKMAVRQFSGEIPDIFISASYKASKDTFAEWYLPEENSGPLTTTPVRFFNYRFNNDYSELTLDVGFGLGLEYGILYKKIDDKYTDTISAASLDMPRSSSYTAGLTFHNAWQQPDEIVKENEYANWTTTSSGTLRINGKEFGLYSPCNLPEGEYEIYFHGTITFLRNELYPRDPSREFRIDKIFHTTLKKGHIYEVKVYVEPRDMYLILSLGPYVHSTLKAAVMLTEISQEQYEKEYW